MSIYYNIILKNKTRVPVSYPCFGMLNCLASRSLRHHYDSFSDFSNDRVQRIARNCEEFDASHIAVVEYNFFKAINPSNSTKRAQNRKLFCEWAINLKSTFPWMEDAYDVHPKMGLIRFHMAGKPADKMLFIMTAIRNKSYDLCRHGGLYSHRTQGFLDKAEGNERLKFIFDSYFYTTSQEDFITGAEVSYGVPRFNDEGNLFNAATFGKEALTRLMNGVEPDWQQEDFGVNPRGYLRDNHYRNQNDFWDDTITEEELDEYLDSSPRNLTGASHDSHILGGYNFNRLSNACSIRGDESIYEDALYHPAIGFYFRQDPQYFLALNEEFIQVALASI